MRSAGCMIDTVPQLVTAGCRTEVNVTMPPGESAPTPGWCANVHRRLPQLPRPLHSLFQTRKNAESENLR
jgi:hypothetical protein